MRYEKNFVVFEGIDGSGKGMQIDFLKEWYRSRKKTDVVFTREHTRDGQWSEQIEALIHGDGANAVSAEKMQLLYILDRKDHLERVVIPALKKGERVICGRYFLSTLAYGGVDRQLHWKTLLENHKEILGDLFVLPARTIFIDVDPDVALQHITDRGEGHTYFETLERQRIIRDAYLSIGPHFEGFAVVDGRGTPEEVFERVKTALADYL
ncbi:MAG: dTMP kinase [Candidatus Paceibacterota bacterium]|jgi:dTMP kinase